MGLGIKKFLFETLRVTKYRLLSTCKRVSGKPVLYHPLLLRGEGSIKFGSNVQNGVIGTAYYYSHYNLMEARYPETEISIGNNVVFNNGVSIVSVSKVTIDDNVMIGNNTSFIDSDGHNLDPSLRDEGEVKVAPIHIRNNVMIYHSCVILKGVTIGEYSVIGTGSVVTKDIPANVYAAGNPAKVIRNL